jgi:hypothetical protein
MVFMGLVCFGLIMIGADSVCLRDDDYRSMFRVAARFRERLSSRLPVPTIAPVAESLAIEDESRVAG